MAWWDEFKDSIKEKEKKSQFYKIKFSKVVTAKNPEEAFDILTEVLKALQITGWEIEEIERTDKKIL